MLLRGALPHPHPAPLERHPLTLATIIFALLIGAIDEFHQSFTPGRSGNDLGDLIADTAGGLLGALFALRSRPPSSPVTRD